MEGRSKWVFGRGRNCQIRSSEDVKTGRTINSFTKWEIWVGVQYESYYMTDGHWHITGHQWTVICRHGLFMTFSECFEHMLG